MTIEGTIETARMIKNSAGEEYLHCTCKGRTFICNDEILAKKVLDSVGIYGIFLYGFFQLGGFRPKANTYYLKDWTKA